MNGALWYLIRTSAANRLRRQLARLRQPRYALAFALGLLYFWFFFLRANGPRAMSDPAAFAGLGIAALFVIAYLAWSWIAGSDRTALAFTRAEVALLFPAPISRRGLILYKLARTQFGILVSVLVWSVILNRAGEPLASLTRGVGLWVALTTLSLHRLGIGLRRAAAGEHGASGLRRGLAPLLVFAAAIAMVGWTFWSQRAAFAAAPDARAWFGALVRAVETAPASWALYPVRVAFDPVVIREPLAWLAAIAQALLLLALHVWWVLSSDAAFEEAAAEASEKQAKVLERMRAQRAGVATVRAKSVRRTLPLTATGHPAVAILWKNALWVLRTHQLRGLLVAPVILLGAALWLAGGSTKAAMIVTALAAVLSAIFLLFGPATMRNDLRSDLLHLPMLKTLPISGRAIVLVQVLSGALAVTLPQLLCAAAAAVAMLRAPEPPGIPAPVIAGVLVGAPALLLAVNVANFTLHNGLALLFPGWVKLGERGPTGIEATGQMMLVSGATLLALALLLLLPVAVGAVGYFAFAREVGTGVVVALLAGSALLGLEAWLLMRGLGRAFARVEPMQVG